MHRTSLKTAGCSFLLLLAALSIPFYGHAQHAIYVKGHVTNKETGNPVENVSIAAEKGNRYLAGTNARGHYAFTTSASTGNLVFSCLGYEKTTIKTGTSGTDTLTIDVKLSPRRESLLPVEITSKPTVVAGFKEDDVEDYELLGTHTLILTKESAEKFKVFLLDAQHQVLRKYTLRAAGSMPVFFKDYNGNVNIVTDEHVYRTELVSDTLRFEDINTAGFYQGIVPCKARLGNYAYFSSQIWDIPYFSYFIYNTRDSTRSVFKKVVDKPLLSAYNAQFAELPDFYDINEAPAYKMWAKWFSEKTGIPLGVVSARLTGFAYSMFYSTLYSPLFVVGDTVCIFDHYQNHLYRYSSSGHLQDSAAIQYHLKKDWKKELIQDRVTQKVYTLYETGGWQQVTPVNTSTGATDKGHFRPTYKYIEKPKIENGYLYYIYRPFESRQAKYLYKEPLPF